MSGGMRIDPKELPLPLREQVGVKIVAELAKATPVAGQAEKCSAQKVTVRRLWFPSTGALARYLVLRAWAREGIVYDLRLWARWHRVRAMTYTVSDPARFKPSGPNVLSLNEGVQIVEVFDEST